MNCNLLTGKLFTRQIADADKNHPLSFQPCHEQKMPEKRCQKKKAEKKGNMRTRMRSSQNADESSLARLWDLTFDSRQSVVFKKGEPKCMEKTSQSIVYSQIQPKSSVESGIKHMSHWWKALHQSFLITTLRNNMAIYFAMQTLENLAWAFWGSSVTASSNLKTILNKR